MHDLSEGDVRHLLEEMLIWTEGHPGYLVREYDDEVLADLCGFGGIKRPFLNRGQAQRQVQQQQQRLAFEKSGRLPSRCQICKKIGHIAANSDFRYSRDDRESLSNKNILASDYRDDIDGGSAIYRNVWY